MERQKDGKRVGHLDTTQNIPYLICQATTGMFGPDDRQTYRQTKAARQ